MNRKSLLMTGAAALVLTMNAWSASTPAASTTSATEDSLIARLKTKVKVGYFGQFNGTSISDPSGYYPGPRTSKSDDTINLYNSISAGYMVSPTVKTYLNPRFEWRPSGTAAGEGVRASAGNDLTFLDPRVGVEVANLVNTADFNLKGIFNAELPASQTSRDRDLVAAPAIAFSGNYNVRNTRFSLGFSTYFRGYVYGQTGAKAGRDLRAYLSPSVSYKISPTVSAIVGYEMLAQKLRKTKGVLPDQWVSEGTDLQPGIAWDITENFNLNPYIQIYPAGKINLETSSIGMYLSGSFL